MNAFLVIVVALAEVAGLGFLLKMRLGQGSRSAVAETGRLTAALDERNELAAEYQAILEGMIEAPELQAKEQEFTAARELLKSERGRNTITQAELETVESRLRELEEIERELEASGIETKEELKILKKKEKDLLQKNDSLKQQIEASTAKLQQLFQEIELSAQMQEQVMSMQTDLIQTQTQIDTLLLQIEQCNEHYFSFKRRYDALDIEYAQLYEKFSAAESGGG